MFLGICAAHHSPISDPGAVSTLDPSSQVHLLGRLTVPAPLRKVTLDNVIAGATCSPIGLADFATYLSFVEDSLPNLQFVLWYQSYQQKFDALPKAVQTLSPPTPTHRHGRSPSATMTHLASITSQESSPGHAFVDGGVYPPSHPGPVAPFASAPTIPRSQQPFRADIDRIIATFLAPDAVRHLQLPDDVRAAVLRALENTTHPEALVSAYDVAYAALRRALPRFLVQSTTVAGWPHRLSMFAQGGAIISVGVLVFLAVLLGAAQRPAHLSDGGIRALRLLVFPFVFCSMLNIIWAAQGHCRTTALTGRAQLQAWEVSAATDQSKVWWDGTDDEQNEAEVAELANAEDGRAAAKAQDTADMPASLSSRACQHAVRVKEQLLAEISALEFPTLRRGKVPPAQPVMISFTRATTVEVDSPPPIPLEDESPEIRKYTADATPYDDVAKTGLDSTPELVSTLTKRADSRGGLVARTKAILDPRIIATHRRIELFTLLSAIGIAVVVTSICVAVPIVRL